MSQWSVPILQASHRNFIFPSYTVVHSPNNTMNTKSNLQNIYFVRSPETSPKNQIQKHQISHLRNLNWIYTIIRAFHWNLTHSKPQNSSNIPYLSCETSPDFIHFKIQRFMPLWSILTLQTSHRSFIFPSYTVVHSPSDTMKTKINLQNNYFVWSPETLPKNQYLE